MSVIEHQVKELLVELAAKDRLILSLAEKLEICAMALTKCAEKRGFP